MTTQDASSLVERHVATTPAENSKALVEKLVQDACGCAPGRRRANGTHHSDDCNKLGERLTAALVTTRNDALEEAAMVADDHGIAWGLAQSTPAIVIATAIRSLKTEGQ